MGKHCLFTMSSSITYKKNESKQVTRAGPAAYCTQNKVRCYFF